MENSFSCWQRLGMCVSTIYNPLKSAPAVTDFQVDDMIEQKSPHFKFLWHLPAPAGEFLISSKVPEVTWHGCPLGWAHSWLCSSLVALDSAHNFNWSLSSKTFATGSNHPVLQHYLCPTSHCCLCEPWNKKNCQVKLLHISTLQNLISSSNHIISYSCITSVSNVLVNLRRKFFCLPNYKCICIIPSILMNLIIIALSSMSSICRPIVIWKWCQER